MARLSELQSKVTGRRISVAPLDKKKSGFQDESQALTERAKLLRADRPAAPVKEVSAAEQARIEAGLRRVEDADRRTYSNMAKEESGGAARPSQKHIADLMWKRDDLEGRIDSLQRGNSGGIGSFTNTAYQQRRTEQIRKMQEELRGIQKELDQAEQAEKQALLDSGGYRRADLKDLTLGSFRQGYNNSIYGQESYKAMTGQKNSADAYRELLEGEEYRFIPDGIAGELLSGVSRQLGQQFRQWTEPRSVAMAGTGAAMAAAAGQAGPQVLAPEEVITVPAGALIGLQAGSALSNYEIEAGLAYDEMVENGISPATARNVATVVGLGNAALETVQADELVKSFKVLRDIPGTQKTARRLWDIMVDRGLSVANETLQETAQEGVTIAGAQAASKLETGDWMYSADQVGDRLKDTALSSALTFAGLNAPGGTYQMLHTAGADRATGRDVGTMDSGAASLEDLAQDMAREQVDRAMPQEPQTVTRATAAGRQRNAATGERTAGYTREEADAIRREGKTFRNLVAGVDITISNFFDKWKNGRKNQAGEKLEKLYIGKMNAPVGREISAILGYDVTERDLIITNDDVKHIMDQHGDAEREVRKGNLPLEPWVFAALPDVLSTPDSITPGHAGGGKKNAGKTGLIFSKTFPNGRVVSIRFDNKGRRTLEVTTLYVKEGNTPSEMDTDQTVPIRTSKTPEPVLPSAPSIAQTAPVGKTDTKESDGTAQSAEAARPRLSMKDFTDVDSPVWRNVAYEDTETQTDIMRGTHQEMVDAGEIVRIPEETVQSVSRSYPDLRGMKKAERTPILRQKMKELKSSLRQFLNGLKGGSYEFEVNGNILEARLYDTGIREVMEKVTQDKASMLYHSEQVFQNARYLYSTPDYDGDPNIYRWNYFYTPVQIGDQTVGVRIAVRDIGKGTDLTPESQIYNWGIKTGAALDGGSRGPKVASSDVSSAAPGAEVKTSASTPSIAQTIPEGNTQYGQSGAGTDRLQAELGPVSSVPAAGGLRLGGERQAILRETVETPGRKAYTGDELHRELDDSGEPIYALTRKDAAIEPTDLRALQKTRRETAARLGMSEAEAFRLEHYVKGFLCYELNTRMLNGALSDGERAIAAEIQSALEKFPQYEGRTYRNLKFDTEQAYDAFLAEYAEGNTVVLKSFTSTSKRPNGYPQFGNGVVHLVVDGRSGRDIADTYGVPRQQEVIYLPGTELIVTRVTEANDGRPLIYTKEAEHGKLRGEESEISGDRGPARGLHRYSDRLGDLAGGEGTVLDRVPEDARRGWGRDGVLPRRREGIETGDVLESETGRSAPVTRGLPGLGMDKAHDPYVGTLSQTQRPAAYTAGRKDAAASLAREKRAAKYEARSRREQDGWTEARASAGPQDGPETSPRRREAGRREQAERDNVRAGTDSGLVFDDYVADTLDETTADRVDRVAKLLGVRVRFVDSVRNGSANAAISGSEVLVEKGNKNPVMFLLGHEWTHRLQDLAPEEYRRFRDFAARDEMAQTYIRDKMAAYRRAGEALDYEAALDEVAADYAGRLMEDGKLLDEFIQKHRDDRSLLEKVRDAIRAVIAKLNGTERRRAQTAEGKLTAALEAGAKQAAKNEARSRREQDGWTEARASAGPQGGPETSPRRREAGRREQAARDKYEARSAREQGDSETRRPKNRLGAAQRHFRRRGEQSTVAEGAARDKYTRAQKNTAQVGGAAKMSMKEKDPYAGRSLSADSSVYSYDFLTALPDMRVTVLPEVSSVRDAGGKVDTSKTVTAGIRNARNAGVERDGKVFVRNGYTGKQLLVTTSSIRHGLNGGMNRLLTNARLGAVIGDVVKNAVPINALQNKAKGVTGTYAMAAYATDSQGREFVAIVTVEQYGGNVSGIEVYDVTHAVSGRQKNASRADTKSQGFYPSTTGTISIEDFLSVVNMTHQSILSEDVLAHLGETRDPNGFYTGQVKFSLKDPVEQKDTLERVQDYDAELLIRNASDGRLQGRRGDATMGPERYSLKEDMVDGEAREESRGSFYARGREGAGGGFTIIEGPAAAYGFRRVGDSLEGGHRGEITREARDTQRELTSLGISADIVDGPVLCNNNGITTARDVQEAVTVDKFHIFISKGATVPARNIAGHEAFHLWASGTDRDVYIETLEDNLVYTNPDLLRFQSRIAEAYLGEEADLSNDRQVKKLREELFAYISGDIHEGVNDEYLRPMFRDYDAVKAAWEELVRKNAGESGSAETARYSLKDLTETERGALLAYKSSDSYKINAKLRDGLPLTEAEQKMVEALDRGLEKLPCVEGTVYRTLNFDDVFAPKEEYEDFMAKHQAGLPVAYKAYTSASTATDGYPLVDGAKYGVILEITSRSSRDLTGLGNNFESETLFPRRTVFDITRVATDKSGHTRIYMEEVEIGGGGKYQGHDTQKRGVAVRDLQEAHPAHSDLRGVPGADPGRDPIRRQGLQGAGAEGEVSRSSLKGDGRGRPLTEEEIYSVQSIGRKSVNDFTAEDIRATERFARRYWEEMGEKSPFFRAWFGDWRANDHTPVERATEPGDARGRVRNQDTGWSINVSGKVFNETRVHNDSYNKTARPYLPYINDIIKKAVLLDSYTMAEGKTKSANSLLMHSLYAVADTGNGPEILKLYVEEMNDPNSADTAKRAYQLQNVEKYRPAAKSSQKTASSISAGADVQSVADLFTVVKHMDSSFRPKEPSVVTDGAGRPLAVYRGADEGSWTFAPELGAYWFSKEEDHAEAMAEERGESRILSVYLDMKDPMRVALPAGKSTGLAAKAHYLRQAKARGHDGVIFEADTDDPLLAGTSYAVFRPEQIKSATDDIGTFDRSDRDIRHSLKGTAIDREMDREIRRLVKEAREGGRSEEDIQADIRALVRAGHQTYAGDRTSLTPEAYVEFARKRGQTAYRVVTDLTAGTAYRAASDEEKDQMVDLALTYADQTAMAAVSSCAVDRWVEKASAAAKAGIPKHRYIPLYARKRCLSPLRDQDGKDIPDSLGLQIMELVYRQKGLTDKQRQRLFQDFGVGKSVRHFSPALVRQKLEKMRQ